MLLNMYPPSSMDSLVGALPLCLLLLSAFNLGAVTAGVAGDTRAAGTNAGVVSGAQGLGTGAAAAGGASALDAKSGLAMSVNDLPITSDHSTSAKALPGANTLAQGNAVVPLPKRPDTRRALARKVSHSRAEEERMAWSTPLPTNASCAPSGFCFPPLCVVHPTTLGSYSFVYSSTVGTTFTTDYIACYQYCSSPIPKAKGAALFHFQINSFTCKCLANVLSLIFTTKNSYISGYTQGLCPYCSAGQSYNPTWGDSCQDCGDCLSRFGSSGACYNGGGGESYKFFSGSFQWWYNAENCPSGTTPDEVGTLTLLTGGSSFTCVSYQQTGGTDTGAFTFSSLNNCNSMITNSDPTCATNNDNDDTFVKVPPLYTTPTRATC